MKQYGNIEKEKQERKRKLRRKSMNTFWVKCSRCGKEQPWQPRKKWIKGLSKKCFRCEKSFVVHRSLMNSQIIKKVEQL
jgi:hypothetical protein